MNRVLRTIAIAAAVMAYCVSGFSQTAEPPVVLTIELDNAVIYRADQADPAKVAQDPGMPTPLPARAFQVWHVVADIVAVNGKPAKGMMYTMTGALMPRMRPQPGQMIADFDGQGPYPYQFLILGPDGTWIGSLYTSGGIPPGVLTVMAGSGPFLGAVGEMRPLPTSRAARNASVAEDPANRRINGGSKLQFMFHLYPKYRPSVNVTATGPSVYHAEDFSQVTPTRPARTGEVLILGARNLGPTKPDLLPPGARPFKADPFEFVNSAVEVTVGGKDAEVIHAIGWPETSDLYQVAFRVPTGITPGMAGIQLTAAWIPSPEVKIPVQ